MRVDSYTATHGHPSHIVFRGDDRPGFDPWLLGIKESGQLVFLVTDELGQAAEVVSRAPIPIGRFVHVAGTFDVERGLLLLLVDGKPVASLEASIRPMGALGGPNPGIGLGRLQSGGGARFDGLIVEVRIIRAALGPEELLRQCLGVEVLVSVAFEGAACSEGLVGGDLWRVLRSGVVSVRVTAVSVWLSGSVTVLSVPVGAS